MSITVDDNSQTTAHVGIVTHVYGERDFTFFEVSPDGNLFGHIWRDDKKVGPVKAATVFPKGRPKGWTMGLRHRDDGTNGMVLEVNGQEIMKFGERLTNGGLVVVDGSATFRVVHGDDVSRRVPATSRNQ